jgi:hypothetical protein
MDKINKSMKIILLQIIESDNSYNKSATKYLYKRHPALWSRILELTHFLPADAKPKQRVWHILHDIWEIPRCPISGENVRWAEKRYLETSGMTAKGKLQHQRGLISDQLWSEDTNRKRSESNKLAVVNGRKYRAKESYTQEWKDSIKNAWVEKHGVENIMFLESVRDKIKETFNKKYGVDNAMQNPDVSKKLSDTLISKGAVPLDKRDEYHRYAEAVRYYTNRNYTMHKLILNPDNLPRKTHHLDHIFSRVDGFLQDIPPEIIGHWTNLRILPAKENLVKNRRSEKAIQQLKEDYEISINTDPIIPKFKKYWKT